MRFRRDKCERKGHNWINFGWSVCGFGPYRYHLTCTTCGGMLQVSEPLKDEEETVEEDDRPRDD